VTGRRSETHGLTEEQLRLVDRFPDQNPNPVLRMADDDELVYANPASAALREGLGLRVGQHLGPELAARIRAAAANPARPVIEVEAGRQTFALLPVALTDLGFINVYGTDITAAKLVARFPDLNPHPVFRVSLEGVLLYANAASRQVTSAFGTSIGEALPDDFRTRILGAVDGSLPASFEVQSSGRTYSLLPVLIPELGFVNVYGTDVTALKALDKFPDQNPNPVLRVSQDGRLIYANPASEPIRESFGVRVGEPLPPDVFARITERLDPSAGDTMEIASGERIFSVLVRSIYEFGFINLYGTEITAVRQIERANELNRRLLLNILPERIADRIQAGETVIAERFDDVTLLFADIVDFTPMSSRMGPQEVVDVLNAVFSAFDDLVDRHGLEKIKTIGDAYMVVGGLPGQPEDHVGRVAEMALGLAAEVDALEIARHHMIRFRIGINTGPVVAGVIGRQKFIYDVWGDTVNTASRMESLGLPGRIQVTQVVYERLRDRFHFEQRGSVDVKGKGRMETWFLTGPLAETTDELAEGENRAARTASPG
jgi:class 3 adenylate cyclase